MGLSKLFGDGRKSAYKTTYKSLVRHLSPYITDKRCYAEIASVLFSVTDLAVFQNGKNRIAVNEIIYPMSSELTGQSVEYLQSRVSFYSEFIRVKQPRADFCFGEGNVDDGLLRIIIALGDIIFDSALIDNYDFAPITVQSIDKCMKFTSIMKKNVTQEIAFLYDYMGKCNW